MGIQSHRKADFCQQPHPRAPAQVEVLGHAQLQPVHGVQGDAGLLRASVRLRQVEIVRAAEGQENFRHGTV